MFYYSADYDQVSEFITQELSSHNNQNLITGKLYQCDASAYSYSAVLTCGYISFWCVRSKGWSERIESACSTHLIGVIKVIIAISWL